MLLPLLVANCATTQPQQRTITSTHFDVFIPQGAQRYKIGSNQKMVVGAPVSQADPAYPASLVTQSIPPRIVCLEIDIDEHGVVYQSRPLYDLPACPANAQAVEPPFVSTAEQAVLHWRFKPTIVCTFPAGTNAQQMSNNCAGEGAQIQPVAIKLAFAFTFTQTHGVTSVNSGALHPED